MSERTADEIISEMGINFAAMLKKSRRDAWRQLVDTFMINLPVIAKSHYTQPLRDVIGIAMEIDKSILGGAGQGNATEPLDAIADRWTFRDEDDDAEIEK